MADILVTCPSCHGQITCDSAWAGQDVDCPLCNKTLTVPAKAGMGGAGQTNPLVPVPPKGPSKLALGGAQTPASSAGRNIPIRNLTQPVAKKKSPLAALLPVLGIVALLAAGGYFGWPYFQQWREKRASAGEVPGPDKSSPTNAVAPVTPAAITLPVVPATWTLDLAAAQVPQARANGMLSGTNFLVDTVRLEAAGASQVLRFIQGEPTAPEREIMVYLRLNPGETLASQNLNISKETRGTSVQMVTKRWKSGPRNTPRLQSYTFGYVLKLEMGSEANGNFPGKVYLALPDKEQSVLAGRFDLPSAAASSVSGAQPTAGGASLQQRELYRRRYGTNPPATR